MSHTRLYVVGAVPGHMDTPLRSVSSPSPRAELITEPSCESSHERCERCDPAERGQRDEGLRPPGARSRERSPCPAQERPEAEGVEHSHREAAEDDECRRKRHQGEAEPARCCPRHAPLQGLQTALSAARRHHQHRLARDLLDRLSGLSGLLSADRGDPLPQLIKGALNALNGPLDCPNEPLIENSDSVVAARSAPTRFLNSSTKVPLPFEPVGEYSGTALSNECPGRNRAAMIC